MRRRKSAQLELPLAHPAGEITAHARIGLGGRPVSYVLKRSARRRLIALTIDERGLRVGAPLRAAQREIDRMLAKHAAWILRKLAEWQQRVASRPRWIDGEELRLLGQPLRLTLVAGAGAPARDGDSLVVGAATHDMGTAVTGWLKREALACFNGRIAHFHPALGIPAPTVRLSSARTRWGSCHAAGRVMLNWRMVQFPLRLIDYVIVHELAHLREMNHSPRFWRVVASVVPEYAAIRKELQTESHRHLRV